MKRLIILVLQAALVVAIVGATYLYTEAQTKPTGVLVFSRNIPRHTKITDGMVKMVTVPDSAVAKVMGRDIKEVLGKYTGDNIIEGEPVFVAKLLNEKSIAPEFTMQGNMRKQSFEVDLARSNGGALKPGDYVDLLYYVEDNAANTARSDFFIRRIPVLDVRNSEAVPLNSLNKQNGEAEFNTGTGKRIPAVITVAVTPDQAKQIVFYKHRGKIDIIVYPEKSANGSSSAPDTAPKLEPTAKAPQPAVKNATAPVAPDYRVGSNPALSKKVDNSRNR